jgi:phosphoglycolate phosphatase-like HAD superfamily hydrolase
VAGKLACATFDEVVYVGDQPWDLRAARELGIAFLGIGRDSRARRLEREGATVVSGYGEPDSFLKLLDTVAGVSG